MIPCKISKYPAKMPDPGGGMVKYIFNYLNMYIQLLVYIAYVPVQIFPSCTVIF